MTSKTGLDAIQIARKLDRFSPQCYQIWHEFGNFFCKIVTKMLVWLLDNFDYLKKLANTLFKTGSKSFLNRQRTCFKTILKIWLLFDQPFWQHWFSGLSVSEHFRTSSIFRSPLYKLKLCSLIPNWPYSFLFINAFSPLYAFLS